MITEDYVSFETAKLLKEKGFNISLDSKDWVCCMYDENGNIHWGVYDKNWYFRITLQMAMRWLREEKGLFIEISVSVDLNGNYHYSYSILDKECKYIRKGYTSFEWNYEEAVEAALLYVLQKNLI